MITYIHTGERDPLITECGAHFGALQATVRHAFEAIKESQRCQQELLDMGDSNSDEPEFEITKRSELQAAFTCAMIAEASILDQLYSTAHDAFYFLRKYALVESDRFDSDTTYEVELKNCIMNCHFVFLHNYLATLDYVLSAIELCNRIRTRQNHVSVDCELPLPHEEETLAKFYEEIGVDPHDMFERFKAAGCWLYMLPEWPYPASTEESKRQARIFVDLLSNFIDGSSTCSFRICDLNHEDQRWLKTLLDEKVVFEEKTRHFNDTYSEEHLEITMPALQV